jgi:hypothetical protein
MASAAAQPFRFMDLPRELRDKIYRNLLCSFIPPLRSDSGLVIMNHSLNMDILRTSSTVHEEAHEVMIKTNQFVHVRSGGGLPISGLFMGHSIPLVGLRRPSEEGGLYDRVSVLSVSLARKGWSTELDSQSRQGQSAEIYDMSCTPVGLLILGRYLNRCCLAL